MSLVLPEARDVGLIASRTPQDPCSRLVVGQGSWTEMDLGQSGQPEKLSFSRPGEGAPERGPLQTLGLSPPRLLPALSPGSFHLFPPGLGVC